MTSREPVIHVVILDGTLSTLVNKSESNAGLTYKLMREVAASNRIFTTYRQGIQWFNWRSILEVVAGIGINSQIRRAYGGLASRYRDGDKIYFFGFSRGAYAVRSLAGIIDQIGLLKPEHAVHRNVRQVFRHYQNNPNSVAAQSVSKNLCRQDVKIEMIGVWDTVKALGIQYPMLWRLAPGQTEFHSAQLGPSTKNGFHALAIDETRRSFAPVLWKSDPKWSGRLEQVWFRGSHADIGGHLGDFHAARPLSNIPLVWILNRAEECGLPLPENWRARFPCDPLAPAHGSKRGIAKFFLFRKRRKMLEDPSESFFSIDDLLAAQQHTTVEYQAKETS